MICSMLIKGKLAHTVMATYLVFISCLLDIIKKSTTDKNMETKKRSVAAGERKSNFGSLTFWVSQLVPLQFMYVICI